MIHERKHGERKGAGKKRPGNIKQIRRGAGEGGKRIQGSSADEILSGRIYLCERKARVLKGKIN